MLGKEILGYHVDEKIDSGGFGTVYKVSKTNVTGTYVRALKHITLPTKKQYTAILNSMGGDSTKADDYFANALKNIIGEIKIFSLLSESGNPNVVRYYENDVVESNSPKRYDIYILMEYLTPFPDYLDDASLTVKDVIKLGKDVLNALIACHSRNIIHRDIKDDNIFVAADGIYKIGDFGVSKSLKDQSRAASIKGTPNFIAPEVYLGKENYDCTVDIYSLGIVLYRLLNNSRNPFLPAFPNPYTSEDEDAAFEARMTGKIPELPAIAKNELGEAVLKAIKPRNERYNTAKEFLDALKLAEKKLSFEYLSQSIDICSVAGQSKNSSSFSGTFNNNSFSHSTSADDQKTAKRNSTIITASVVEDDKFETIGLFGDDFNRTIVKEKIPLPPTNNSDKTIISENVVHNWIETEKDRTVESFNFQSGTFYNDVEVSKNTYTVNRYDKAKEEIQTPKSEKKSSKNKTAIIVIIAMLGVILLGVITYLTVSSIYERFMSFFKRMVDLIKESSV